MKPYLLNPNGDEPEQSRVSLFDVLTEHGKPLADKVRIEQDKWTKWVEDAILPSILQNAKPTLLSEAGIVVKVDAAVPDDQWFIFSEVPVASPIVGTDDPYALEFDDLKYRMDFGMVPGGWPEPNPWWAETHAPVWTLPGG